MATEADQDVIELVPIQPPAATAVSGLQTTTNEDGREEQVRSQLATWAILTALYLSEFIAALDTTITATAVPVICADLHSSSGYLWIGAAFMLADAAGTPIWAKASDIWGRKPALLTAVLVFAAGSVLAATAVNMQMLITGRAVQGAAGGGITSLVSIVISDIFSVRRRSLYLGILDFVWATAGAIGPIVGGLFTQLASWRWNFYLNLPVCGLSLVLLSLFLNVHNPRTSLVRGLLVVDWVGTLSMLTVTIMVLLGLDLGGAVYPWSSPKVVCLIVVGASSSLLFILSQKKLAKYPLMPLHIFRTRSVSLAFALTACHGLVQMGTEYYLPLYFQSVRSASPLRSGILVLPLIILTAFGSALAGILIHHTGKYREVMWTGFILLTLGLGLYIRWGGHTVLGELIGFEILEGFGAGLLFQPPLVAVQAAVRQADTAGAIATLAFIRNLASSLGVVLGGVVFQNGMQTQCPTLRAAGLNDTLLAAFSPRNAAASVTIIEHISDPLQREAVKMAYGWSMRNIWILFTAIGGAGLVTSVFTQHRELSREHTETVTGIDALSKREN